MSKSLCDDKLFVVEDFIEHDEILKYCSVMMHHGGAGTTGTCAALGIPQGKISFDRLLQRIC
jgi:UDP:flavonoid glycosyltransferase YjiC (YdhE family)